MTKYAMAIDLNKCIGCHACAIACKAEWGLEDQTSRCWVLPIGPEETAEGMASTFYTGLCNHCDSPACVDECPTGATYKDKTGRVVVNKELCIGCANCVISCPYNARYISAIDKKAEKCTFCEGRITEGVLPACVETCPTQARVFGDIENSRSEVYEKVFTEDYYPLATPALNLGPNVFYTSKQRDYSLLMKYYSPNKLSKVETITTWSDLNPIITGTLGLTSLGVIGAFMAQLFFGEQDEHE